MILYRLCINTQFSMHGASLHFGLIIGMNYSHVKPQELYIQTPFRLTISGSSGTGKTRWIQRFIRHHKEIVGITFDTILFTYGEHQELFNEIKEENPAIVWCEGFCHDTVLNVLHPDTSHKLLIIDDLLSEIC